MNAITQLRLVQYMNKQAMSMLGDDAFEQGANAFSMLPGVGFLGNGVNMVREFGRGNILKGLGQGAIGAVSAVTGGLGGAAARGIGLGARAMGFGARALPTATKGLSMVNRGARAATGMNRFAETGVGKMFNKNPIKSNIGVGLGAGMLPNTAARTMEQKNQQFDGLMSLGKNTSDLAGSIGRMAGVTGDPRYLTPPPMPAMSGVFSHN